MQKTYAAREFYANHLLKYGIELAKVYGSCLLRLTTFDTC